MPELVCNICGGQEFTDFNTRKQVRCAACLSLERTRLLFMYIQQLNVPQTAHILHLAPEKGLHSYFTTVLKAPNYVPADISPEHFNYVPECQKIDLCQLQDWPSDQFDLIINSHVLEHCRCEVEGIFTGLHRMLKPDGVHFCLIPFKPGPSDQDLNLHDLEQQTLRFGQSDHVRVFGVDDRMETLGKIIKLPASFDASTEFSSEELRKANIPEFIWRGYNASMVLKLKKSDLLI